jgi:HNH endonuclease
MMNMNPLSPEVRFWLRVQKSETCWLWTGAKVRGRYGQLMVENKLVYAHRFAYELAYGPIPQGIGYHGICVCHRCDNPSCVRPDHLFLGTHQENISDRDAKGRQWQGEKRSSANRGARNPQAKLSTDKIIEIRKDQRPLRDVAEHYQVSISTVSMVRTRRRWAHIT